MEKKINHVYTTIIMTTEIREFIGWHSRNFAWVYVAAGQA